LDVVHVITSEFFPVGRETIIFAMRARCDKSFNEIAVNSSQKLKPFRVQAPDGSRRACRVVALCRHCTRLLGAYSHWRVGFWISAGLPIGAAMALDVRQHGGMCGDKRNRVVVIAQVHIAWLAVCVW
jgi:hypothetical protein